MISVRLRTATCRWVLSRLPTYDDAATAKSLDRLNSAAPAELFEPYIFILLFELHDLVSNFVFCSSSLMTSSKVS